MFFTNLVGSILFLYSFVVCSSVTENTDVIEYCNELRSNRKLLLVSTLDGQLTALTLDKGEKQWSVATEPGPLLSSTIHHLELSENSQLVRIIPSLSGGLYKFDGESIEPMPVTTDTLLRSYWDDVDISGGKEIRSYAIDIESGHVYYECSMNECSNWTENTYLHTDMIILRRETQKVRAVELQSRAERWNYSVGLHNVTVSHNAIPECNLDPKKSTEFYVRAVVPKGLIYVSRRTDPEDTLWKYEFDSPIVNAWTLVGSQLEWVDLFKPLENSSRKVKPLQPALYIGIHDDQLYIQESEPLYKSQMQLGKARFSMKKYRLIHALDFENKQDVVPLITDESERNSTTALAMLYGSELVKGEGYYLYCTEGNGDCQTQKGRFSTFLSAISASLVSCWKEILILLLVTGYVIHCLFPSPQWTLLSVIENLKTKINRIRRIEKPTEPLEVVSSGCDSGIGGIVCQTGYEVKDFSSRYKEDFEPIRCLGKGGFGVVFQARNKIDDCHYAVKRIRLPNRKEDRERVMREVKALAKLEHRHIVRYFHAWQECPPLGWQEEQDKLWKSKTKDELLSSEAEGFSEMSKASASTRFSRPSQFNSGITNVARETEGDLSDSFIVFESSQPNRSAISNKYDATTTVEKSSHSPRHRTTSVKKSANTTSKVYLYIQMQLCQENSLREWLRDNMERDQSTVLQMFNQIVQAVEYVHLQGLIHRDLKPRNIFFSPDGLVKVGDFGLVTEIIEDHDLIVEPEKQFISKGTHTADVGTTYYMSPEQRLSTQYTYKVDIYSLGVVLFELLTPFYTETERDTVLRELREGEFPPDFHVKHQLEFELLEQMLSENPEKRPTTFGIRSRSPFSNFDTSEQAAPSEWHFELPPKGCNSSNILRKSSNEIA